MPFFPKEFYQIFLLQCPIHFDTSCQAPRVILFTLAKWQEVDLNNTCSLSKGVFSGARTFPYTSHDKSDTTSIGTKLISFKDKKTSGGTSDGSFVDRWLLCSCHPSSSLHLLFYFSLPRFLYCALVPAVRTECKHLSLSSFTRWFRSLLNGG